MTGFSPGDRVIGGTVLPYGAFGEYAVMDAAADARLLVVGLPEDWQAQGIGDTRRAVASRAVPPVLAVRRGVRAVRPRVLAWGRLVPQLLERVAGDDGDDARRLGPGQLDLREEPLDAHLGDRAVQSVPRAHVLRACVAAQPLDLVEGDESPVRAVALGVDPPLAVPAAQRVDADPQLPGRLGCGVCLLRHARGIHIGIA